MNNTAVVPVSAPDTMLWHSRDRIENGSFIGRYAQQYGLSIGSGLFFIVFFFFVIK